MFFRPDYAAPGKGVNKRDPKQSKLSIFFEILPRKMWNLFKANILYLLTSLPTLFVTMIVVGILSSRITESMMPMIANYLNLSGVDMANADFVNSVVIVDLILRAIVAFLFMVILGQGPATAGITYILRNYAREDHAWMLGDWWKHTKNNFVQALSVWIIDLVMLCIFAIAVNTYMNMGGIGLVLSGVIIVMAIIYMTMHFYIYQLMVTFESSIKDLYKNAFALAAQKLPRNLLMLAIIFFVYVGVPVWGAFAGWSMVVWCTVLVVEVAVLPTLSGFMTNFFINAQLEEYIKDANDAVLKANETE